MRVMLLTAWVLVAVAAGAYHWGPGQDRMRLDDADAAIQLAQRRVADGDWGGAVTAYEDALRLLPAERVGVQRRVRLERAKAQMNASQLPVAHRDLQGLLDDLENASDADPALVAETRRALANAQYFMTWLMRLEGLRREVWEPEIESARQSFRLLAEQADASGDAEAAKSCREDLESAILLARMDLKDLQGLPLPSQ